MAAQIYDKLSGVIRVLVVEDDFMVAKAYRLFIERAAGFVVANCVHTGQAALEQVLSDRPELVVLDLYLPDLSGLEVLRQIRAAGLGTDVIVISAACQAETVRDVLRAGAVDYIVKPFRTERLMASLAEYRQHRTELPAAGALAQEEIDRLLGWHHRFVASEPSRSAIKGIDPATLSRISRALASAGRAMTGDEVAAAAGVSRTTAHRYLRHLAAVGEVQAQPVYGSVGRPELLYTRDSH